MLRRQIKKLTDIELLVEEVNKKVHIDDGEATKIKSIVFRKAGVFADFYFEEQKHIQAITCSRIQERSVYSLDVFTLEESL